MNKKSIDSQSINTLGDLKRKGYQSKGIKQEIRDNLIRKIRNKEKIFEGIIGFDDTVIPDIERALLAGHNILLLGLRGQAKTRIARLLVQLLDEYIPIIQGSELNDDPMYPISKTGKDLINQLGDETPISWLPRTERYIEKLATPDVSVADLIGDIDPIKAATLKLPYSDERVIHYGLVPRAHRSVFVINELPDLQARIQVSLFNILQEGDIQIRGFKIRLPLDIQFVFTANPEDYTNRGSIITPLKDRIESQIITHYPKSLEISKQITQQEARIHKDQSRITVPPVIEDLLEMITAKARESELIDEKSGVSARLSITAYELLYSAAERRMLMNGDEETDVRITDFWGMVPAITGKVELVYEGEQLGPYSVALELFEDAVSELFLQFFPKPDEVEKREMKDPYGILRAYFSGGNYIDLLSNSKNSEYKQSLENVQGLRKMVEYFNVPERWKYVFMELVLFGLAEFEVLNKEVMEEKFSFKDPFSNIFDDLNN
ncbi:MAG TPA: sigma 54-interacting transcriptional regulator [Saprospiraceae bacterium]|nr:sigma 54-interacting transcriptional regulator [Saprospiraceae bacterium]